MGELKGVVIILSSNPNIFQIIDIIVMDIPESYGLLLIRAWSSKLNAYFSIDWSHLLFPWKGQQNQISIDSEKYMKYVITKLSHLNEPVMFSNSILGKMIVSSLSLISLRMKLTMRQNHTCSFKSPIVPRLLSSTTTTL